MNENVDSTMREKKQSGIPGWAIWAAALIFVFLLGFVPVWWQYREANKANDISQAQLRKAETKNLLTSSIVEAKNGEYEISRQNMSEFFTKLDAEIEKGDNGNLTTSEREKLKPIFTNRDNIITLLAQRDPASVERLTDIYAIYKQAFGQLQKPAQVPTP